MMTNTGFSGRPDITLAEINGKLAKSTVVFGDAKAQARGKDAKEVRELKEERKKTEHEHPDDRDKKNGERDR